MVFKNLLDDKYYVLDVGILHKLLPLEEFFIETYYKYSCNINWHIIDKKMKIGEQGILTTLSKKDSELLFIPEGATAFLIVLISDSQK